MTRKFWRWCGKISQIQCALYSSCVLCYKFLIKCNLYRNAYQALTIDHKYWYLLCISVTQVLHEWSFSTLKYIKNELRNKLNCENAETFMLKSIEKYILVNIDNDNNIIDFRRGSCYQRLFENENIIHIIWTYFIYYILMSVLTLYVCIPSQKKHIKKKLLCKIRIM